MLMYRYQKKGSCLEIKAKMIFKHLLTYGSHLGMEFFFVKREDSKKK